MNFKLSHKTIKNTKSEIYIFVNILKIIAIILITTAHYERIYPQVVSELLASGGNLGNSLFFMISGYLINNKKNSPFFSWIMSKFFRLYTFLWILYFFLHIFFIFRITPNNFIDLLILASNYHFIGRLFLFYILGFSILSSEFLYNRLSKILLLSIIIQFILYTFYDRSVYTIDSIGNFMILFLFFNSFLIGMYLKKIGRPLIRSTFLSFILFFLSLPLYFFISIFIRNNTFNLDFQILSPYSLIFLSFSLFNLFAKFEFRYFSSTTIYRFISTTISNKTLEIYLVQIPFIPILNIGPFPLNFILVSISIFLLAQILGFFGNNLINIFYKFKPLFMKYIKFNKY